MAKTTTCEIVLIIDGEGHFGVGFNHENALDNYDGNAETNTGSGVRIFNLNLTVPLPVAAKVTGTLPDVPGGEVTLTVV